jgi:signal transduction histidine kinase
VADDALDGSTDPARMREALGKLSEWMGQATAEGRAALHSLRASTTQRNDLAEALRHVAESDLVPKTMSVSFSTAGAASEMHPIVRDEIYRIGYEAIRNAAVHSRGSRLEIELRYGQDLILRVRDNGAGIDPQVLEKGKAGHFGLQGMRERTARIGGRFTGASSPASGTEIQIVVPGKIIFLRTGSPRNTVQSRVKRLFQRNL